MYPMYSNQRGFTVPEILVGLAIASVVLVGIMTLFVGLTNNSAATVKIADQIRNNNSAIATIEDDLRATRTFLATPSLADSNASFSPVQPDGWVFNGTGSDARILILQTYATTGNPKEDNRQIVTRDDGLGGCPVGRFPVYNNVIYFLKDSNLYRRVLVEASVPPSTTYCGSNPTDPAATIFQKQTCANPTASTTDNCAHLDVIVAKGITKFGVSYYQEPGDTSALDSVYTLNATDASAMLSGVKSIRVDIATLGEPTENIQALDSYRRLTKGVFRAL